MRTVSGYVILLDSPKKQTNKQKESWQGHRNSCSQLQRANYITHIPNTLILVSSWQEITASAISNSVSFSQLHFSKVTSDAFFDGGHLVMRSAKPVNHLNKENTFLSAPNSTLGTIAFFSHPAVCFRVNHR